MLEKQESPWTRSYSPFVALTDEKMQRSQSEDEFSLASHESILDTFGNLLTVFFDAASFKSAVISVDESREQDTLHEISSFIDETASVSSSRAEISASHYREDSSRVPPASPDRNETEENFQEQERFTSSPRSIFLSPSDLAVAYRGDKKPQLLRRPVALAVYDTLCDDDGRTVVITSNRKEDSSGSSLASQSPKLGRSFDMSPTNVTSSASWTTH